MKLLKALVATALLFPALANADLIRLDAESAGSDGNFLFDDFSIIFYDDGDEVLTFQEIRRFAGVRIAPSVPGPVNFSLYRYLVQIAGTEFSGESQAPGLSTSQTLDLLTNYNNQWVFSNTPDLSNWVGVSFAHYTVSIAKVPEPGTLTLLLLGLAGIAFMHRRRRVAGHAD